MISLRQLRKRLSSNKEGKTVVKNFGYLMLLQIAGYVFPFITMPYLARVVGTTGFGKIAFASAIICWAQTVADWGFNYTATRDVAQNRDNADRVSEIFSNVLWARMLLTMLSLIVLLVAIAFVPTFRADADIILVTFIMVPGHIFFPDWFFQALERMKYTTMMNIAIKFIFTICVFLFIKHPGDYIIQPLLTSIAYVLCGCYSLWLILGKWGYKLKAPRWRQIFCTIKGSTDVFINNLMPNLYNSFSVMLLGSLSGATANGLYDGGNKFVSIACNFQNVLSRAFFPFLSRRIDRSAFFAKINMLSGIAVAILLFVFAPVIVDIFLGAEFRNSISVMRVLAISIIFLVLSNTYGTNYLILIHKERLLRNITGICSLIGMLAAFPLISRFSYLGTAYTVCLSRTLLGLGVFAYAKYEMYKRHKEYNSMNINQSGGVICLEPLEFRTFGYNVARARMPFALVYNY